MATADMGLRPIGDLAWESGLAVRTLRYYAKAANDGPEGPLSCHLASRLMKEA